MGTDSTKLSSIAAHQPVHDPDAAAAAAKRTKARLRWVVAGVIAFSGCACWRVYREVIPAGVSERYVFLDWSVKGRSFRSPDGRHEVQVVFNDAGAMHSG